MQEAVANKKSQEKIPSETPTEENEQEVPSDEECDMSAGSIYQAYQIEMEEEKYKNLKSIKQSIQKMELPRLPLALKPRPKTRPKGMPGISRFGFLRATSFANKKRKALLANPLGKNSSSILFRDEVSDNIPRSTVSTSYAKARLECFSLERSPQKESKKAFVASSESPVADYRAKLILDKARLYLNRELYVPLAKRQCKSREMARNISSQKLIRNEQPKKKRHHRKKIEVNTNAPPVSPSFMLKQTSTVYKTLWPRELGKGISAKFMIQTLSPIAKSSHLFNKKYQYN